MLTRLFEAFATKKGVNEKVDAFFRGVFFQKLRKNVLRRRRNGDIVCESDGTEHEETDETGYDGEDEDENEEVEDGGDAERGGRGRRRRGLRRRGRRRRR